MTNAEPAPPQIPLTEIPSLILRRASPFQTVAYLPEWSFWFFVFEEQASFKSLPIAEESGRCYINNYPVGARPPTAYLEAERVYGDRWWASVHPSEHDAGSLAWDRINLMREIEIATEHLSSDIVWRRKGRSDLILSMAGAGKNPPRIEFDVGTVPVVFGLNQYHPGRDRSYSQQIFFGFWGPGQVPFWSIREVKPKLKTIMEFYNVFLPLFSRAT